MFIYIYTKHIRYVYIYIHNWLVGGIYLPSFNWNDDYSPYIYIYTYGKTKNVPVSTNQLGSDGSEFGSESTDE